MLAKRIRVTIWLIQSMISRYKKQLILSFVIGSILWVILWQFGPLISDTLYPSKQVIGIIGSYEPTNLPLVIQKNISRGFTEISEDGSASPDLASSWESNKEGTRYFFYFEDGTNWHDGTEFTAHDVNYNFRDVEISSADRHTLKIELDEPFAPLPSLLSRPLFKEGLIGLGEYEVREIDINGNTVERIILKRFDIDEDIDTTKPELLEFKIYPSLKAATTAFQLGEVDYLLDVPNTKSFDKEPNVVIEPSIQKDKFLGLFFNNSKDPFTEREFRQALSYATPDLEGEKVISPIPADSWAHNPRVRQYTHDLEQAKKLIEEGGLKDTTITIHTFPEYLDIAQTIANSWNEIGVSTDVKVTHFIPPDYDVLLGVQEIPSDPDQYQLWHSTQQGTNIANYNSAKIDKLLEEGRKTTVKDEREELYNDFQRFLLEDAAVHFLIHPTVYEISRG